MPCGQFVYLSPVPRMLYRECVRCVMDTSDPLISFDGEGRCNHCREFFEKTWHLWMPNAEGERQLRERVAAIRREGAAMEFDCILGLSGGVDSSYLALRLADYGLRPLVVHVDAGWNSEIAVRNIEMIVSHCGFELHTHVMDWEDMRNLQLAYLRAGLSNQDVPQDHAFFATLYRFANANRIRNIISGGNIATEGIFPASWHGSAMDAINLRAVYKRWGGPPLRRYQTVSFWEVYVTFPLVRRMSVLRPLNFMPYNRQAAIEELQRSCGWRSYGRKHGESLFTRFFQNHYLPVKFGIDKRRAHLSSLIVSGQITREQAVNELEEALYLPNELEGDIDYLCRKLGLSRSEFDVLMTTQNGHYSDYPNWDSRYRMLKRIQTIVERVTGSSAARYS
jgi:N-acetyl sugar amidotransferase